MHLWVRKLWQRKLVRNTVWMLFGHGSRVGLQAAYFILLARTLGAEGLGVFSGALALAKIMLPFAGWGSDEVLVRRTSRNSSEFNEALGNALLITAFSGALFTGIALVINQALFAGRVSWQLILLIASGELVLYRLQYLTRRAFQAFERLNITAVFKAAPSLTLVVGVVAFRATNPERDVDVWGLWYFGAMAIPGIAGIIVTLALLGRPKFVMAAAMKQLREGFFFSLSESAKTAYTDADKILLLRLLSREIAGVYKAAYRLLSVLMTPVLALMDAAYARFFKTGAGGVRGSYRFALKLMPLTVLYTAVVATAMWLSAPLLPLLLGKSYQGSVEIIRWLAPIPVFQAASYLLMQTLTGGDFQKQRSIGQLLVAIFNIAGNVVLIPIYGWQAAAGMAVASELLLLVMMFGLCTWSARRQPQGTEESAADHPDQSPTSSKRRA
ncbi:MAG: oligosaccharide flippase family protein [Deltaproteobacteria bacterium]|nr:oligosaccharide flippase family protein [Deltaproteobacteria bacterium]MBW2537036.1 oligosaccharide flippase family protein [Deltaproteobacteria bacterium]